MHTLSTKSNSVWYNVVYLTLKRFIYLQMSNTKFPLSNIVKKLTIFIMEKNLRLRSF